MGVTLCSCLALLWYTFLVNGDSSLWKDYELALGLFWLGLSIQIYAIFRFHFNPVLGALIWSAMELTSAVAFWFTESEALNLYGWRSSVEFSAALTVFTASLTKITELVRKENDYWPAFVHSNSLRQARVKTTIASGALLGGLLVAV